ncbi:hypothetical protein NLM24_30000 [Nocardia zapadnayensis]|nr:hypothetical protein [Nocardia zapadnayensis]
MGTRFLCTREALAHDRVEQRIVAGTSNATVFADRPDIETYLLDRFAVIGTPSECRDRLVGLSDYVDGAYLSVHFEDVAGQLDRIGDLLAMM